MIPVVPINAQTALQTSAWVRNGRYPSGNMTGQLAQDVNHIMRYRSKEPFSWSTPIANLLTSATSTPRWRFAFHSSKFVSRLWCLAIMATSNSAKNDDAATTLTIKNGAGTTQGTIDLHFGNALTNPGDTPANFGLVAGVLKSSGAVVAVPTDTDLYGDFADSNSGRLVAASVFEVPFDVDTANGYVADADAVAFGAPILDVTRQTITQNLRNSWKQSAAHLWNWTVERDADKISTVNTTGINIVDNSSTTVSASTPGATLDLANKSTVRRTTVPCAFKAYGSNASNVGQVVLKDSGGTTLATIAVNSTLQWYSTTVNLPATAAKYDIMFLSTNGFTQTLLYQVSLYQYE